MKTSTVFAKAKKLVTKQPDNAYRRYICHAIEDSEGVSHEDARRAKRIISKLLGDSGSLEVWLSKRGLAPGYADLTTNHKIKMQVTRHAWLNSLIKEYKAKGD